MAQQAHKPSPQIHPSSSVKQEKKEVNSMLCLLLILSTFGVTMSQFFIYTNQSSEGVTATAITVGVSLPVFIVVTCIYGRDKKEIVKLYFLLDNILVTYLICVAGFIGLMMIFAQLGRVYSSSELAVGILQLINLFVFAGTYRILARSTIWKNWQVILTKLVLIVAMVALIFLTMQIIKSTAVSEEIKNFFFVYIFGFFSFEYEIYSKITEIDGTGQLNFHYTNAKETPSEEQINFSTQNEGTRVVLEDVGGN